MRIASLLSLACAAALVLGACAAKTPTPGLSPTAASPTTDSSPSTASPTAAPTSPSTPTAPAVRTITITVRGKTVTPAPSRVSLKKGETLRLVVTTAADDILHAHGFGVEKPLLAGKPTTADLVGAEPGQYEIETHEPALLLLVVRVR